MQKCTASCLRFSSQEVDLRGGILDSALTHCIMKVLPKRADKKMWKQSKKGGPQEGCEVQQKVASTQSPRASGR